VFSVARFGTIAARRGIQVKVVDQFLEVCLLSADDKFVAVLEQMAVASVAAGDDLSFSGPSEQSERTLGIRGATI
jgi:hypothetical protein